MQVPVTMDQVLLQWDGGKSVVLARIRDAEGCWLCSIEVHRKLVTSISAGSWANHIDRGNYMP